MGFRYIAISYALFILIGVVWGILADPSEWLTWLTWLGCGWICAVLMWLLGWPADEES